MMSDLSRVVATQVKPTRERWIVAAILFIAVFSAFIDRVNVSVLMVDKTFLTDLGIDGAVAKGMLMTSFLIAYAIGNVVLSPLGDIFGPRKAMAGCITVWVVAMLVGGLASTYVIIIVSRIMLGLGEALHFPMQSSYVKLWFPPAERGKANAVWQTGSAMAPAVAMPLFAGIISMAGWRMSFFVLAALSLIPLFLIWYFTADTPRQSKRVNELERDYVEAGQATETTATGEKEGQEFIAAFKACASNNKFWLVTLFYMMHVSIYFGTLTWLPSYLKNAHGFSWAAMGILASLPFLLAVGTKILSGYLADKLRRRSSILLAEMIGVGIGVYFAATVSDHNLSAAFLILGTGAVGLGGPATWTVLQSIVPGKSVGSASGLMNGLSNGVSALAPIGIGFLISVTGTYAGGLAYIVGCAVLGTIMALILYLNKL